MNRRASVPDAAAAPASPPGDPEGIVAAGLELLPADPARASERDLLTVVATGQALAAAIAATGADIRRPPGCRLSRERPQVRRDRCQAAAQRLDDYAAAAFAAHGHASVARLTGPPPQPPAAEGTVTKPFHQPPKEAIKCQI